MLTSDAKTPALYDAAIYYAALGYAVIPIYGNMVPTRAKVAATDWAHFQHQHPSDMDLKRWFHMYTMGGLALITGHISQLLVLDFDQLDLHQRFVAAFPHLCETRVVTSAQRRLPHYYYRPPAGLEVASRKIVGLDLLAEGRYVVAPPTQIAGSSYIVTQDLEPLSLSPEDINAITAFMDDPLGFINKSHAVTRDTVSPSYLSVSKSFLTGHQSYTVTTDTLYGISQANAVTSDTVTTDTLSDMQNTASSSHTVTADTLSSRLAHAASVALNTLRLVAKEIISESDAVSSVLTDHQRNKTQNTHVSSHSLSSEKIKSLSQCRYADKRVKADNREVFSDTVTRDTLSAHALVTEMAEVAYTVTADTLSPERLIQQYQQMAIQLGRNEALFRIGVKARDFGWSQAETESILVSAHARQSTSSAHAPETPRQRIREAQRTIASVYKRPARKVQYQETRIGLPVSVREILLALKQMPLLRVLDGLILKGIAAGARLTEKFVTTLLEKIVGRHSVLKALKAVLPDGTAAFAPSPGTPTNTLVADEVTLFPGQKMLFVGVTESNKNRRGRPEQAYEMPSIDRLCQALGVRYTPSDPITAEDLKSTRRTRQAIHRELLHRRPGLYSRALLARRLGVSVRSVQRYHRGAGVQVQAAYRQREVFWETLNCIPETDDQPAHSAFLQEDTGKRYPLDMAIAKWLLTHKKRVFLMYQLPNHYSVLRESDAAQSDEPQMASRERALLRLAAAAEQSETTIGSTQIAACSHKNLSQGNTVGEVVSKAAAGVKIANVSYHKSKNLPIGAPEKKASLSGTAPISQNLSSVSTRLMDTPAQETALIFTSQPVPAQRYLPQEAYGKPLMSLTMERAAQHLYDVLRERCREKMGYMTLSKARQLLDQFGTSAVKRATHLLEKRSNVQNPAGFLISVLRSNARVAGVLA